MENKFRIISGRRNKEQPESGNEKLLEEIKSVCREIENTYANFEFEQDGDLVEAAIYELESLKARYRYLLRMAKSQQITCDAAGSLESEGQVDKMG